MRNPPEIPTQADEIIAILAPEQMAAVTENQRFCLNLVANCGCVALVAIIALSAGATIIFCCGN